ncbi:uncharacterized protein LOC115099316 [Rhinatrema bivittatum]|uniref:uncharacterized protein LOC115099316 n=1 Tax=Rhinatrema bivittatum TaxID=194408 RepID=UPI00112BD1DD|nr:uncharacterized protein LOC115099316 [Rhinatrema bivittatum]
MLRLHLLLLVTDQDLQDLPLWRGLPGRIPILSGSHNGKATSHPGTALVTTAGKLMRGIGVFLLRAGLLVLNLRIQQEVMLGHGVGILARDLSRVGFTRMVGRDTVPMEMQEVLVRLLLFLVCRYRVGQRRRRARYVEARRVAQHSRSDSRTRGRDSETKLVSGAGWWYMLESGGLDSRTFLYCPSISTCLQSPIWSAFGLAWERDMCSLDWTQWDDVE